VDFVALDLRDEARRAPPGDRHPTHFRRAKVLAALVVAALVGAGSYTATYRALVIISVPSAVAPIHASGLTAVPAGAAPLFLSGV
jgi:hypothetical protein